MVGYHKSRGRSSNRRIKEKVKSRILKLFREKYHDFGPTLAAEKLFRTFQDRLIKEMRLRGIKSILQGNEFLGKYLPIYGKRFGIKAAKPMDLHRAIPSRISGA